MPPNRFKSETLEGSEILVLDLNHQPMVFSMLVVLWKIEDSQEEVGKNKGNNNESFEETWKNK